MTDPQTAVIAAGYDAIADPWADWTKRIDGDPRRAWCDELVRRLPSGARVVELGCGGGSKETADLAERFHLTAIDVSGEQLRHARERVPEAELVHADFTELELEPGSVDAVAAFYAFNHVPRELLAGLVTIREPEGPATFQWVLAQT